jgi:hypothetical protein
MANSRRGRVPLLFFFSLGSLSNFILVHFLCASFSVVVYSYGKLYCATVARPLYLGFVGVRDLFFISNLNWEGDDCSRQREKLRWWCSTEAVRAPPSPASAEIVTMSSRLEFRVCMGDSGDEKRALNFFSNFVRSYILIQ